MTIKRILQCPECRWETAFDLGESIERGEGSYFEQCEQCGAFLEVPEPLKTQFLYEEVKNLRKAVWDLEMKVRHLERATKDDHK